MKPFCKHGRLLWREDLAVLLECSIYCFEQQLWIDHDCMAVCHEQLWSLQGKLPLALDVALVHQAVSKANPELIGNTVKVAEPWDMRVQPIGRRLVLTRQCQEVDRGTTHQTTGKSIF